MPALKWLPGGSQKLFGCEACAKASFVAFQLIVLPELVAPALS